MAVLVILMGLAFPAFTSVQNAARKTQAKNDLVQIVTAVNAFYTEYGQYPCAAQSGADTADYVSDGTATTLQADLMKNLRARTGGALNTRQIVFLSPADVKDTANPRSGVGSDEKFYDPWGSAYKIQIDNNYNNVLTNPYAADKGAGPASLNAGVIGWSLGKNGALGGGAAAAGSTFSKESGTAGEFANSSDVISWQ